MSKRKNHRTSTCLTGLLGLYFTASAQAIVINEIRTDQPGSDIDEYFELAGIAGESLDGLSYLVIGDSSTGKSGVIESVTNLNGRQIASNGYFLVAENSFSLGATPDLTSSLKFENNDNVTHLLVRGLSAQIGDDLDLTDDGLLDFTPWTGILDSLALIKSFTSGEEIYSPTQLGKGDGNVPVHAFRNPAKQGMWQTGNTDTSNDTAGRSNGIITVPEPTTLSLLVLGMLAYRHKQKREIPEIEMNRHVDISISG